MMMMLFIGTYSVTTTLVSAFTHVKKERNVAPLNRPRALYKPPPRGVGMHLMLTTVPPHPAWFPPKRGSACSATLHHTPVGPSVCTEAGCRLTLFTPGPACLFPLDYIDNLYIHMAPHLTT